MELFYTKNTNFSNVSKLSKDDFLGLNSSILVGSNVNYKYNIFSGDLFLGVLEKSYMSDFLFNIEKNKDLGYEYKIFFTQFSYYSTGLKIDIFYNPQILLERIKTDQISEFENCFFKQLLQSLSKRNVINDRWKEKSCCSNSILKQPKKLAVKLFPYQLESLNRMKEIEDKKNNHDLDTKRSLGEVFRCVNSNLESSKIFDDVLFDMYECRIDSISKHTYYASGGILADEMGLGKTITSTGLIIERPYIYKPNTIEKSEDDSEFKFEVKNVFDTICLVSKATLIICPSHLTKQWSLEITKANPNLKQIMFLTKVNHEKHNYQNILDADVVIVSFQFLFNIGYYVNYDHYKNNGTRWTKSYLSSPDQINKRCSDIRKLVTFSKKTIESCDPIIFESIHWNRIIIDEGHEMFSSSYNFEHVYLQVFLKNLSCNNKWFISGTPFYDVKSLTNVMNFLDFGTRIRSNTNSYIMTLENSMNYGLSELNIVNSIFKQIYIRNTKESVKDQLDIPSANIENIMISFSDFENTLYTSLKYANENYLRQICCNIQICDKFSNGNLENILNFNEVKEKLIKDNEEKIIKTQLSIQNLDATVPGYDARKKMLENIVISCNFLLNCFKDSNIKVNDECCPICRCEYDDPVVTECGHNFCYECITEVIGIESYKKECPICRTAISPSKIFKLEEDIHVEEEKVDELVYKYGTKIAKLIKLCKQILLDDKNKIIIFSEWDRLLSMIGIVLKNNDIKNVFCKGNVHQRNAAISAFRSDLSKKRKSYDNVSRVIMLSTEHAASGTNLTDATHIIFMEPHNGEYGAVKSMEDQAIGRAVRLGQQNQVNVYRLITKNTIEEEIITKYLQGLDTGTENTSISNNQNLPIDI